MRIILICAQCGKSFSRIRAHIRGIRHFCSLACRGQGQRKRHLIVCAFCKKIHERVASHNGRSTSAYCSRICYLAAQQPLPLEKRFWTYVERQAADNCWPWLGAIDSKGYGVFSIAVGKNDHRINKRAHRIAHELIYGPLLPGFQINHRCNMRRCCNPQHGYVGTQLENVRDMIQAGNHFWAKLTHVMIQDIRNSTLPASKLATLYGVDPRTILKVRKRKSWKHQA